MSSNRALDELDSNCDVGQAKRDLVLRFVRDQESLQTSQVDLKLVDDETIDLIDSAFNSKDSQENDKTDHSIRTGVAGLNLDEGREVPLTPRPPSGSRPRRQRKTCYESKDKPGQLSYHVRMRSDSDMDRQTRPMSPTAVYQAGTNTYSSSKTSNPLNSSWPQQQFVSRKLSSGSSRKYVLCSPENKTFDNGGDGTRPTSTQRHISNGGDGTRPTSTRRHISTREVLAARVTKHSASNRVSCNLGQISVDPSSTCSSPTKTFSARKRATSRGRAQFLNLNLEPVHPSELPLLRGGSAPYTLVQLPPIQSRETPAATPPFG